MGYASQRVAPASLPTPSECLMHITLNGHPRAIEAPPPVTLAILVQELGLEGKRIAVERNGAIVPRSRYGETALEDGDRLEIVGAVGGG